MAPHHEEVLGPMGTVRVPQGGRGRGGGRRPTRAGHRLDSFLLNSPLVPWAARERPHFNAGTVPCIAGVGS